MITSFSKKIVAVVIILAVLFTIAVLWVFVKTGGNEPTVLVASVFAFLTSELWNLARIKINGGVSYEDKLETEINEQETVDGVSRCD